MSSAQTLNDLMLQLQNLESSVTAVLMEAVIKMAALTDANFFMMVETRDGRRFAGKRHLCDAYVEGQLGPIGEDYEIQVDPAVSAVKVSRILGQTQRGSTLSQHISPTGLHSSRPLSNETQSPSRKRGSPGAFSSKPNKLRRIAPAFPIVSLADAGSAAGGSAATTTAPGVADADIVCVAEDVKVETDGATMTTPDHHYRDKDGGEQDVVEFATDNHNGKSVVIHDQSSLVADISVEASQQRLLDNTRSNQPQNLQYLSTESISEILQGPFPMSEALEAKIAACEVYSCTPLRSLQLHPAENDAASENDVAMKIIKSTFYDISKVIASEFVSVLRSRCLSPESDPKQFLRARFNVVLSTHPALQTIHESGTPEFKAWDYTRTNFTCIVKRLMKLKRLTSLDLSSALDQQIM